MKKITWSMILAIGLFSCESADQDRSQSDTSQQKKAIDGMENEDTEDVKERVNFEDEVDFAKYCSSLLADGNIDALRPYTDGEILFSPYAYIQPKARKVTLAEIKEHTDDVHYWGDYDGSGDSISLTTLEYINQFVLSFDLTDEKVKVNKSTATPKVYGNELNNVQKKFPGATYVQFYHPPTKKDYMDWKALLFVVEKKENSFILKAIIHNQWTV